MTKRHSTLAIIYAFLSSGNESSPDDIPFPSTEIPAKRRQSISGLAFNPLPPRVCLCFVRSVWATATGPFVRLMHVAWVAERQLKLGMRVGKRKRREAAKTWSTKYTQFCAVWNWAPILKGYASNKYFHVPWETCRLKISVCRPSRFSGSEFSDSWIRCQSPVLNTPWQEKWCVWSKEKS